MAWAGYEQLVKQDQAAAEFSSITGKGVTVAMVDTGIDYNLPQLGGGIGKGHKVLGGYDFYANDDDPMDESGHGTNTASVVAASSYTVNGVHYQGVAPGANLVALRVGTESSISDNNIERALQWVIANYQTYGIDVVNISLGSGFYPDAETSSQLSDEFQTLHDDGIFVVAASGNSNDSIVGPITQDGIAYPAADPNVFAVGAVDPHDVITTWAQRGDELDLLAPGADIVMPKLGGGFVTEDGTSFSSPYVAGAAALIKQANTDALAGDIGSVLMTSASLNRDGDNESGNTTGLDYARLDIDAALKLTSQRVGKFAAIDFGTNYDTALDSQGVLHAAWYQGTATGGELMYATRDIAGLWSAASVVDASGNAGLMPSIAVDHTGKVGIGYFDLINADVKYASFNGATWSAASVDSKKFVGWSPSLAYDIDGNAYLAYYKRSGGYLRMATLDRDTGTWSLRTVDGGNGVNVGLSLSLDVGEAGIRSTSGFTVYHTTVAVAYSDQTNGDLKYARLDLDDPTATWYTAVVDDAGGVSRINLNLHNGPEEIGLQAQIVYQDAAGADVKYAFRRTTWHVETVASTGKLGDYTQFYFDTNDNPIAVYYDRVKRALYLSARSSTGVWSKKKLTTSAGPLSVAMNERTGHATLSWLNRPKTDVLSAGLL
jgi:hypothetical protein